MSHRAIDWTHDVATTVGVVTATACDSIPIPDGANATLEITLQGRETTTGEHAAWKAFHSLKKVGGKLELVGTLVELITMAHGSDVALASAAPSLVVVDDSLVRLVVAGVAGKTIEWFADIRVRLN